MSDWLKMEKHTPEKPEILAMSSLLSLDPEIVFTKCFKVWRWADSQTVDGNAPGVTSALLDSLVSVTGFGAAMLKVGWLDEEGGSIAFPNFGFHMGESAKKRALIQKRVQESRKRNARSVTEALPKALPDKRREENSTEEETPLPPLTKPTRKKPKEEPVAIPKELDTPAFRQAWLTWLQHLKEKRKKLTPTSQREQMQEFVEMGEKRAVAALEHSTKKGWGSVFEPQENNNGRSGKPVGQSRSRIAGEANKYATVPTIEANGPPAPGTPQAVPSAEQGPRPGSCAGNLPFDTPRPGPG